MIARVPGLRFKDMVARDPRVQKMHAFRKAGHYSLPFAELTKTILTLQAQRKYREISSREIIRHSQVQIIDWSGELSAYFSRVNTIRMQAFAKKRKLDEHISRCRKYLENEYGTFLKAESTTVKGREFMAKESLATFNSLSYQLETLILLADMFITELDKNGYSINHSLEAVKLSSRPERNH